MYKNEEEKLTDIMLGEAIMVLLKEDAAINKAALIKQLHAMSTHERDPRRQMACKRAIFEVRDSLAASNDSFSEDKGDMDNIMHLFASDGSPDGSKKH